MTYLKGQWILECPIAVVYEEFNEVIDVPG